jgi:V/A-type H+-transporting ATPase subunit F
MVSNAAEAADALQQAVKRPDLGVLIIADNTAAEIREQVDAVRLDCERPLLVEVLGPSGPVSGRKSLRQLVQEAVGIRISQEEESE